MPDALKTWQTGKMLFEKLTGQLFSISKLERKCQKISTFLTIYHKNAHSEKKRLLFSIGDDW